MSLLDQIIKQLASAYLQTPVPIFSWLSLRYEQNYGIAWSIPIPYPLLLFLNIVLLLAMPYIAGKLVDLSHKRSQLALGFILGGAIGNIFDRLFYGYVVDYVALSFWPVFNLADALLAIGIFLIIVFYGKIRKVN